MRLIDANALTVEFNKRCKGECCCCTEDYFGSGNDGCGCRVIDDAPTVDAVKHGHWIFNDNHHTFRCSCCGSVELIGWVLERAKYCPNCGAKMDGKGDAE